ncbi:hypothetical protein Droror1_Dr00010872 [Drosera rotundifolia]
MPSHTDGSISFYGEVVDRRGGGTTQGKPSRGAFSTSFPFPSLVSHLPPPRFSPSPPPLGFQIMTTFTAVALDRLLDPGASRSAATATKNSETETVESRRGKSVGAWMGVPPRAEIGRRNSDTAVEGERRGVGQWRMGNPALYVTPEATPLPDSPGLDSRSEMLSPYVINHKRRGPRLVKTSSEQSVAAKGGSSGVGNGHLRDNEVAGNGHSSDKEVVRVGLSNGKEEVGNGHLSDTDLVCNGHLSSKKVFNNGHLNQTKVVGNGHLNGKKVASNGHLSDMKVVSNGGLSDTENGMVGAVMKEVNANGFKGHNDGDGRQASVSIGEKGELNKVGGLSMEGEGEAEDFFDPQESLGYASCTDVEDNNAEQSGRISTPGGEFFDAWEELSADSGRQSHRAISELEAELRELQLSYLTEIEKRKQAEEALTNMRNQWQMLKEKMRSIGLVLPPDSSQVDAKPDVDSAEEICRQFYVSRFISENIGMEVSKDEAKAEMQAHLEIKNFEIARLNDRLHYYESMNREMSQRNQETIERARHDRQTRKRILRWVWGSVGVAVAVGGVALAWSYIPGGEVSSSTDHLKTAEPDTSAGC